MPPKRIPKKIKKKRGKKEEEPSDQPSSLKATPKKERQKDLEMLLKELSPYRPQYGSTFKSHLFMSNPKDLVMIETPISKNSRFAFMEQIDVELPKFQDIMIMENKNASSSSSSSQYSSESSKYSSPMESQPIPSQAGDPEELIEPPKQLKPIEVIIPEKSQSPQKNIKNLSTSNKKPQPQKLRRIFCNCKKTKCLKLYCDCFRDNLTCDGCNCVGCHNLQQYEEERNNAILSLMDRNPDAFKPKIELEQHAKGCHCKKSNCLKKYCECFQAGLRCGQNCKCQECKNGGDKGEEVNERDNIETKGIKTAKKERRFEEWALES